MSTDKPSDTNGPIQRLVALGKNLTAVVGLATLIYMLVSQLFNFNFGANPYLFLITFSIIAGLAWFLLLYDEPLDNVEYWNNVIKFTTALLFALVVVGLALVIWYVFEISLLFVIILIMLGTILGIAVKNRNVIFTLLSGKRKLYQTLKYAFLIAVIGVFLYASYSEVQARFFAPPPPPSLTFEIETDNSLPGDHNAFELTDALIWQRKKLDSQGLSIAFMVKIKPEYNGDEVIDKVIARFRGNGPREVIKPLWDDFSKSSGDTTVSLTLLELWDVSGLEINYDSEDNPFQEDKVTFANGMISVEILDASNQSDPLYSDTIILRNTPWNVRATLNEHQEAHVQLHNLGAPGEFTVHYKLAKIENPLGTAGIPDFNGTTSLQTWIQPPDYKFLGTDEYYADTFMLPDLSDPGRYILEVYGIKKQDYVQFQDSQEGWKNLTWPWWFGNSNAQHLIFVVPPPENERPLKEPEPIDDSVQTELNRLANEGVDFGFPLTNLENVESPISGSGQRQVFENGEIYLKDGQVYGIYGPILEYYQSHDGVDNGSIGFPTSRLRAVTSSSGKQGSMMVFEKPDDNQLNTRIYSSDVGTALVSYWIEGVYDSKGAHEGWLGFPLDDEHFYQDSTVQMFENGYFIYLHRQMDSEKQYWEPIPMPYLTSEGNWVDVNSQEPWTDTGLPVHSGDQVTVMQISGSWSNTDESEGEFDANGDITSELLESRILPSVYPGVLIARIGDADPFPMGRWSTIVAEAEGNLYLGMNDSYHGDNTGQLTVQVVVKPKE